MNKKQKNLLKYSKQKDNDNRLIPRAAFEFDKAKWYILAFIIIFHILPLILLAFGDIGISIMDNLFMVYLNPMLVFAILLIFGVREGFSLKMCVIGILLGSISVVMYYTREYDPEKGLLYYPLVSFTVALFSYSIMGFLGNLLGAFVKHLGIFV